MPRFDRLPGKGRILIAFSGGPDSTCLLHMAAGSGCGRPLLAVHVDHGLDSGSGRRAATAGRFAQTLGVPFERLKVRIVPDHGSGPEAAARKARYRALASTMRAGETLLTAHHADDQAETVLLRLLRGAGPAGLAGIPRQREFAEGWLFRPLLDWTRDQILDYLRGWKLDWVDDPANKDLAADRNYLRHRVLPRIRERWPGAEKSLDTSARLCRAAADAMDRQARADLDACMRTREDGETVLDAATWLAPGRIRARQALVCWCRDAGLDPPPVPRTEAFMLQCVRAGHDRLPALSWEHGSMHRFDGQIWRDPPVRAHTGWHLHWTGTRTVELPHGLGALELRGGADALPDADLEVTSGNTGERLQLSARGCRQRVSELMRRAGVPPWRRADWPRVHYAGRLAAVGDRWLDDGFRQWLRQHGLDLVWHRQPISGCPDTGTIPTVSNAD